MSSEEEVVAEVEAVEAMYGDDCVVLHHFPPHLHLRIKPRTAGVSSEQFVEATIGIRATSKYPDEPPFISVIDSKGLHDRMHDQLVSSIRDKAVELSSCMMMVVLCEEAVETLSGMNYPDGDCPMCLCPLYGEDDGSPSMPFVKLMSCFHCFHGECILNWYKWLQAEEIRKKNYGRRGGNIKGSGTGTCPVCRKVFLAKDLEHVLDMAGAHPDSWFVKC